jgi:hypothetical protein
MPGGDAETGRSVRELWASGWSTQLDALLNVNGELDVNVRITIAVSGSGSV